MAVNSDINIGEKLKKFRQDKGLSVLAFAKLYDFNKENLYKWEKGTKPTDYGEVNRLLEILENDPSIVSEPLQPYVEKRRQLKTTDFPPIPVFAGNTQAGIITVYSDDPTMQKPVGHLPAELFPGCNHAEKVTGDSMYPLIINQGWVIGKVIDKKGIIWGEKYSIHTTYGLAVVKYVHPGTTKGSIKLVSHNKNVPPQEIPLDEVTFCCRIYHIINPA